MNVTAMVAEVQAQGFPMVTSARIIVWINEAYRTVARKAKIRDFLALSTQALAAGTATYTLPPDLGHMISVTEVNNDYPLAPMAPEWFDIQPTATGMPTVYMLDSTGLTVYPTPNATGSYLLRYRYYRDPVDMVGADTPVIPSPYHDALIAYAISRAYRSEDDPQQAGAFMVDFDRRVAELIVDRRAEIYDGPIQVAGTWGGRRIGGDWR